MSRQTLADVLHTLRGFVEEVARRHPGKPPILYGNCQAGWALALLSADCEGLSGPVVLNGSPLSYWAGESGVNPMRVAGGLTGGVWGRSLCSRFWLSCTRSWRAPRNERLWPNSATPTRCTWRACRDLFRESPISSAGLCKSIPDATD